MLQRVLISGVTGFVGRPLAAALADEGLEIDGVSRSPTRARDAVPGLREVHTPDELNGEVLSQVRAVVSLAGESVSGRWTRKKKRRIEESRVEGTRQIVDAIAAADTRPEVLVSASAMGFYGDRGEEELSEDASSGDDFLADVCVAWEREALRAEALGVRVVLLRIGLVLGEDGGALGAMLPLFKARLGGRMGSGRQWWSWIHIADLVRLIAMAIDDDSMSGAYNAVAPEAVRQAEFTRVLADVLGRPAFLPAPAFALRTMLGEFACELLSSRRVVPKRTRQAGFGFRHADLEGALRAAVGA